MRAAVRLGKSQTLATLGILVAIITTVILAYYPGLHGPFFFDDIVNFVDKNAVAIQALDFTSLVNAALSNESGILKRPLPAISFALNYYFSGGFENTFHFKITNLIIHLANTGLIYWLGSLLFKVVSENSGLPQRKWHVWLPGLTATVWALHPLQLTSVLYVVQRMTSLSALFVLAGLIVFVHGRRLLYDGDPQGKKLMWIGLLGGTVLGLTCKENAALLPLYALVIEYVFFRDARPDRTRSTPMLIYVVPLALLGLLAAYWLVRRPDLILHAYNLREFTLGERLLTEPRILWFYVSLVLFPASNRFSLFHDDMPVSTGLFDPWTTGLALSGLILSVIVALFSRRKYPLLSFSILWFLAGHVMESSFVGLELAHEHRNYLPIFGPIAAMVYGIGVATEHFKIRTASTTLSVLTIAALAFTTHVLARIWANEQDLIAFMLEHHPESARAHATLADRYLRVQNDPIQALNHYLIAADLAPYETSYLIRMVVVSAASTVLETKPAPSAGSPARERRIPHGPVKIEKGSKGLRLVLDRSIHDRIPQQLQSQPIHARVEQMLSELTDCILRHPDYCGVLYDDAVNWHNLALNNPRSNISIRRSLILNLGRLHLEHDDLERALLIAERSKEIDAYSPVLGIMRANIYYITNRLDDAEKTLLSAIRSGSVIDKENREQADKLLSMIQRQRHDAGSE